MEGLSLVNRQRYIQKDRRLRNEYIEDLIVTYGHVHRDQIVRLYEIVSKVAGGEGEEGFDPQTAKRMLQQFQKKMRRCWYDPGTRTFFSSRTQDIAEVINNPGYLPLERCMWLLLLFLPQADFHYPSLGSERVGQIVMHREDRRYQIAYCPSGAETYLDNRIRDEHLLQFNQANSYPLTDEEVEMIRNERYILLLESEVQLEKIKSPSIAYAYVLEKNGSCRLCSQG